MLRLLLLSLDSCTLALAQEVPEYGPAKGTLLIVGGGNHSGSGISQTFINKAGGLSAKIIIVPAVGGNRNADGTIQVFKEEQILASWTKLGCTNVHMLHTHEAKVADTEEFAQTLRDASGAWFNGGRRWNIVD